MAELKIYKSLVSLLLDVIGGMNGDVVQAFDGEEHSYFVVKKYNLKALQKQHPHLRSFAKLGTANGGVFKAEIDWEKADMDIHEFSQQGVRCRNCAFSDSIEFNSGLPADRANEIWNALLKHQKSECTEVLFYLVH